MPVICTFLVLSLILLSLTDSNLILKIIPRSIDYALQAFFTVLTDSHRPLIVHEVICLESLVGSTSFISVEVDEHGVFGGCDGE